MRIRNALILAAAVMSNSLLAQPADATGKLQFEAASIKASQTDIQARTVMLRLTDMMPAAMIPMPDPGRVRIQGSTLRHLIAAAYRVRTDQISAPAWIQDQNFDIEAKMPEGAKTDQAHEMLRELLAQRFGLVLHREARELSGFVLTVGKHGPLLEPYVPPAQPEPSGTPEENLARLKEKVAERARKDRKPWRSEHETHRFHAGRAPPGRVAR